jgi:hypothetical protein
MIPLYYVTPKVDLFIYITIPAMERRCYFMCLAANTPLYLDVIKDRHGTITVL